MGNTMTGSVFCMITTGAKTSPTPLCDRLQTMGNTDNNTEAKSTVKAKCCSDTGANAKQGGSHLKSEYTLKTGWLSFKLQRWIFTGPCFSSLVHVHTETFFRRDTLNILSASLTLLTSNSSSLSNNKFRRSPT